MNKITFAIMLTLLSTVGFTMAAPEYDSMSDVTNAFEHIHLCGWGFFKGRVVVGKLEKPKDARIAARMPFHDDGSYCTALYSGRKIMFYAHGYDPIHVVSTNLVDPGVIDAGVSIFNKSKPENLRTLETRINVDKPEILSTPIKAALSINNYDYLWEDHGYRCGARRIVQVASKKAEPGEPIQFGGLSRIPYYLNLSAKGFISQKIKIDPAASGTIDLGTLKLLSATTLKITYRTRIRKNGKKWQTDETYKTGTIICNGQNEFKFTDLRDGLGNSLELRFEPKENGTVEASFFHWDENNFRTLGNIKASDAPDFSDIDIETYEGRAYLPVAENELYLFRKHEVNDTDIEILFLAERI